MLVTRVSAQWICGLGLMQLLFATGLTVCGFIVLGMFHSLDCKGIWLGMPMMIPGLLSIVVMATRHRKSSIITFLCSIVVLALCAYHGVNVWEDIDYWEKYRGLAETDSGDGSFALPCYNRGDHCICSDSTEYLDKSYTVQSCDMFRTGEELFWAMIALTVGGALFTLLNAIVCVWASFTGHAREMEPEDKHRNPPEYDHPSSRQNYALHH